MELIGKCPKCGKHNIIDSKRRIKPSVKPIHRYGRCGTCQIVKKHTIVGEIVKRFIRWSSFRIRFW